MTLFLSLAFFPDTNDTNAPAESEKFSAFNTFAVGNTVQSIIGILIIMLGSFLFAWNGYKNKGIDWDYEWIAEQEAATKEM